MRGSVIIMNDLQPNLFNFNVKSPEEVKHGGYRPSHPWYYKTGGKILSVSEISFDTSYIVIGKPKYNIDYSYKKLLADICIYFHLVENKNKALSKYELEILEHNWIDTIWLIHNHVSNSKSEIFNAGGDPEVFSSITSFESAKSLMEGRFDTKIEKVI